MSVDADSLRTWAPRALILLLTALVAWYALRRIRKN